MINVTNFTNMFIVNNLRPYTQYSVYVTAVKLINATGRLLDGEKSETVIERTLAGGCYITHIGVILFHFSYIAPIIEENNSDLPELTVNGNITNDTTIVIDLPHVSNDNGPFRLVSVHSNNFTDNLYNM